MRASRLRQPAVVALDQLAYSAPNLILTLSIARNVSPGIFGLFAVGYAFYGLAASAIQSSFGEALLLRPTLALARSSLVATLALGVPLGLALLVGAILAGQVATFGLFVFAVLPALLGLEIQRAYLIGAGKVNRALAIDLVWAVLAASAAAVLDLVNEPSIANYLFWWSFAGAVAFMTGSRLVPLAIEHRPRVVLDTLGREGQIRNYLLESVLLGVIAQAAVPVVGLVSTLSAAGAFRAAQTLYTPIQFAHALLRYVGLPRLASPGGQGRVASLARRALAVASLAALAWATVLTVMPRRLGSALLGDTYVLAADLTLPFGVHRVILGLSVVAYMCSRALAPNWSSPTLRISTAAVRLALLAFGAWWGGAQGAIAGMVVGEAVNALLQYRVFRSLERNDVAP